MKGFLLGLMGAAAVKVLFDTWLSELSGRDIAVICLTLLFLWLGHRYRKKGG